MEDLNPHIQHMETLKRMPVLPRALRNLVRLCEKEGREFEELAKIVSFRDRVLDFVNSNYLGLPHRLESMDQVAALFGADTFKNITICTSVSELFDQTRREATPHLEDFWGHSVRCALVAKLIADKLQYKRWDEAFVAGLFHDVGKLILLANFPDQYGNLLVTSRGWNDLLQGEIRLAATHAEIGAAFLRALHLHSFVADSVLYHHEPEDRIPNALPLVKVLYVANALCQELTVTEEKSYRIAEDILGFYRPAVKEILYQCHKAEKEVAHSLGIEIEPLAEFPRKARREKAEAPTLPVQGVTILLEALAGLFEAPGKDAIVTTLWRAVHRFFGVKSILFFFLDPEKDVLIGSRIEEGKKVVPVEELLFPLKRDGGLLVRCLEEEKALDSFGRSTTEPLALSDEQVIRFMGKEGMVSFPMSFRGERTGVVVLALDEADFLSISKNMKILTTLIHQGAIAFHLDQLGKRRFKTIQTERLSALSSIARKISHEVSNPLTIIKNYLKILGKKLAEQNIAQDEITIINEEIDRIIMILQGLASISGMRRPRRAEPVDINALLADLVKITREPLLNEQGVKVHLHLDPSDPKAMAETNGLKQVFINLINNAKEAMPGGGNLLMETRRISRPAGTSQEEGGRGIVEILFQDEGIGIPEPIKAKLFEPFVSSKGGNHPGLGLSIVHNIIESLDGHILCESHKEKGTTFKISLPLVNDKKA